MLTFSNKTIISLTVLITCLMVVTSCASRNHGMYYNYSPEVTFADFSPTEKNFAVVFSWKYINGIILFTHDGKAIRWLCKNTEKKYYSEPRFSPDGERIAFVAGETDAYAHIYIMDKDGGNIRRLTNSPGRDRIPAFSSDGRKVYFFRQPPPEKYKYAHADVWCIDLESLHEMVITNYDFARYYALAVMPDDKHILISGFITPQFENVLWKIDIDQPEKITPLIPDLTSFADQPARRFLDKYQPSIAVPFKGMSRDGRYLIFPWANPESHDVNTHPQAYVADLANMKTTKLPNRTFSHAVPIAITADGQLILIHNYPLPTPTYGSIYPKSILYIVTRDGSGLRNLTLDFTAIWPEVLEAKRIHERGW